MGLLDFFRPVPQWTAKQAKDFMRISKSEEYELVDVRQPREYNRGHLPGAILMPVGEVPDRLDELDPEKTQIVYCSHGVRGRAATAVLVRAGHRHAHNLKGGLKAWDHALATLQREEEMSYLPKSGSVVELIALLWSFEEGSQRLYGTLADELGGDIGSGLFARLAEAEKSHKSFLREAYQKETDEPIPEGFPESVLGVTSLDHVMEGGLSVSAALEALRYGDLKEMTAVAMAAETNARDLHLRMARQVESEEAKSLFHRLADEEAGHLQELADEMERIR